MADGRWQMADGRWQTADGIGREQRKGWDGRGWDGMINANLDDVQVAYCGKVQVQVECTSKVLCGGSQSQQS